MNASGSSVLPRLWLVRHAAPQIAPGRCYGRLDVPAEPEATRQAARALAPALPARLAAVHHSTLQRCEQLALVLQGLRPDLTLQPDARLVEMDFGRWEGRPWDAIARAEIDAWAAQLPRHAPGGGEALADMLARVAEALAAARRQAATGGDVVWLTHAGVARCVQWLLRHGGARLPRAGDWTLPAPAYGRWMSVPLAPG